MKHIYFSSSNNYEKLHIYRIVFENKDDRINSNIFQKFINESFHIEYNYIFHLNPSKYQLVPQYVIDECDKIIESL